MAKRRRNYEIAPDEIFLDATQSIDVDHDRFEGRLERPLARSSFATIGIGLAVLFLILVAGAWNLQVRQGTAYAAESAHNSLDATTIFAERGTIVDDQGVVLAENAQADDGSVKRVYTIPAMGQIIGYVSYPKKDSSGNYYDTEETGISGLEAEYNSSLAGQNGQLLAETDALGKIQSQGTVNPAVDGQTLHLSIDADLESKLAAADGRDQSHRILSLVRPERDEQWYACRNHRDIQHEFAKTLPRSRSRRSLCAGLYREALGGRRCSYRRHHHALDDYL
jgi:penicillin-binding protein 2